MHKALVILHKEWLELRGERTLLMTVIVPPLLLTILPIVALYLIGSNPHEHTSQPAPFPPTAPPRGGT
jgi:hypothetical protein